MRCAALLAAAGAAGPAGAGAQPAGALRNWFDDPFFPISSAVPGCPLPAGPFMTEAQRRTEAHHRAERGTSCWLAGQCERPNAYAYDRDIAAALQARLAAHNPFAAGTTLWITVQARVVYLEGCVRDAAVVPRLEAFARAVPQVQQALAIVRVGASQPVPYRVLTPPSPPPASPRTPPPRSR